MPWRTKFAHQSVTVRGIQFFGVIDSPANVYHSISFLIFMPFSQVISFRHFYLKVCTVNLKQIHNVGGLRVTGDLAKCTIDNINVQLESTMCVSGRGRYKVVHIVEKIKFADFIVVVAASE